MPGVNSAGRADFGPECPNSLPGVPAVPESETHFRCHGWLVQPSRRRPTPRTDSGKKRGSDSVTGRVPPSILGGEKRGPLVCQRRFGKPDGQGQGNHPADNHQRSHGPDSAKRTGVARQGLLFVNRSGPELAGRTHFPPKHVVRRNRGTLSDLSLNPYSDFFWAHEVASFAGVRESCPLRGGPRE